MGELKALLPFGGRTLLEFQVGELRACREVSQVLVVVGYRKEKLLPFLKGAQAVENPDYEFGPTTSIKAGLKVLAPGRKGMLILGVDQPRPRRLLSSLLGEHQKGLYPITVPTFQGRRGHPVILASALLPELMKISEEEKGLRGFLEKHRDRVREVAVNSPWVLLDLNTPQDYQQALSLLGR